MIKLFLCALAPVAALALAGAVHADDGNPWSRISRPSGGPAQAIGGFARGCLSGAATLPWDGPGFEAIHLSRGRYYGHPETVDFVERLGARAAASGLPTLYVGDMAQARGGPLPFGHASHQTGLDVDIWFSPAPKPALAPAARENIDLPSMLLPNWRAVNRRRFGAPQIALLRLAASDPQVDRIFVNPVIKMALCRAVPPADRGWLHRLRPWFGHDDHFHVRLSCPADSPTCERQAPVPPGDGCDAILASWVRGQRPPQPQPTISAPLPARQPGILPPACHALLAAP
jgi:penicillin-insensitive murein endopeptidase